MENMTDKIPKPAMLQFKRVPNLETRQKTKPSRCCDMRGVWCVYKSVLPQHQILS